ncbi:hypothetical protein V2J09_007587, partial [Rumex salicifolius]
ILFAPYLKKKKTREKKGACQHIQTLLSTQIQQQQHYNSTKKKKKKKKKEKERAAIGEIGFTLQRTEMAAFYPTSTAQVDGLSTPYIQDQKFVSYSESPIIHGNMMMYLNPSSSAGSFSEIAPGTSMSAHNCVDIQNMTGRNEVMFIPPNINGQLNTTGDTMTHSVAQELQLSSRNQLNIIDGEQNLHGLSLSLSTQMSGALPPPPFQHQFSDVGHAPVLSTHMPLPGKIDESSQGKDMRNSGYGQFDLHGSAQDSVGFGAPNNLQYSVNPKTVGYNAYQFEQAGFANIILKSKYLKPAQQLLDEVVHVQEALKRHESGKDQIMNKADEESMDSKEKNVPALDADGSTTASQEISATERQELQNKLDKLLAMLDEVDRRYKQYYHQMQILVSSFDMVAGCGAAKPYTTLALKTISRHFRSLRDAINSQIQATRKSLGEQDCGPGGVIPRLRYVDQQLRQQRALQQFGMMRHAWRPQRGLPENAVTVLRAWLFEHFLHPYPKDSEKIMLARQTGLTRGQVANWFINARVRLWKPMVEEMYKEEFGEADLNSKSSPENASKAGGGEKSWASEDRRDELQESSLASMAESGHPGPSTENSDMARNRGLIKTQENHHHQNQPCLDSHGFYPHDHNSLMAYQVPEIGSYGVNNSQVSLALGLRRMEGGAVQVTTATQFRPVSSTENAIESVTSEYSYLEPVNQQQHRFDNSHLLHDFVA